MTTTSIANKPIMIVETDPKNEIDDEIFIHWALGSLKGYNVYFMCVPGCETRDPEKASMVAIERVEHVASLFVSQFGTNYNYNTQESEFHLCTVMDLIEMLRRRNSDVPLEVAYYVKIAPSWHINPWFYSQLKISTRIVMGDLSKPDTSINCTKAMHPTNDESLRDEYAEQESTIVSAFTISIPTNFARQIAFTYNYINGLPDQLRTPLVDKWYSQFVGRPPAHLPWACDISLANLMTIKNMFPQDNAKMRDIVDYCGQNEIDPTHRIELSIKIDTFLTNAPYMDKEVYNTYRQRLLMIAMLVEEITGCYYADSEFGSESLTDNTMARKNWNEFLAEYKPNATPAYDLIAAVALKEPASLADVALCRDAISRIND